MENIEILWIEVFYFCTLKVSGVDWAVFAVFR